MHHQTSAQSQSCVHNPQKMTQPILSSFMWIPPSLTRSHAANQQRKRSGHIRIFKVSLFTHFLLFIQAIKALPIEMGQSPGPSAVSGP